MVKGPDLRLSTAERDALLRALEQTGGDATRAAGELCISVPTLYHKLKLHGLPRPRVAGSSASRHRREIDFMRAERIAVKNAYYAYLRDAGRISHDVTGIVAKTQELLRELDRVPDKERAAQVADLRAKFGKLMARMRVLDGAA